MAISARFTADFSQFSTAVNKAELTLKSFETGAGRVETALNRLGDSFSGRKIIQDATLAVAAIEKLGGVSTLTATEQRKVNGIVTEAIAKYQALGQQAPKALADLANATKQSGTATSSWFNELGTSIAGTMAGFVSAQAIISAASGVFRTLSGFVRDSVKAYSEQESATRRLTAALTAHGTATPITIKAYQDLATQFQKTTVFSDELIIEMQALLTQVGNVMPAQMQSALTAATNLASGLQIDLRTATMLVGKAFEGETGTLKRYGIIIDETKLKTEGVTAVLDAIQQRFGGQAQAEIDTYAGKVRQLSNAFNELQEAVGQAVIQNPLMEAGLRAIKAQLTETNAGVVDLTHSWSNFLSVAGFPQLSKMVRALEDIADRANQAARMLELANRIKPMAGHETAQDRKAAGEAEIEAMRKQFAAIQQYEQGIARTKAALASLTTEEKRAIEAGLKIKSVAEVAAYMAAKYGTAAEAVQAFAASQRESTGASKAAASEAKHLRTEAEALVGRYRAMGQATHDNQIMLQKQINALSDSADKHRQLGTLIDWVVGKYSTWLQDLQHINEGFKRNNDTLIAYAKTLQMVQTVEGDRLGPPTLISAPDLPADFNRRMLEQAGAQLEDDARRAEEAWREYVGAIYLAGSAIDSFARSADGALREHLQDLGTIFEAWSRAAMAVEQYQQATTTAGKVGAVIGGVGAVWSATGSQNRGAAVGGGALAGMQAGMMFGPYGAAIGAVAGAITGLIRSAGQGREAVEEFAESFGGFDALREKMNELGDEGERLWIKLTQTVGKNDVKAAEQVANEILRAFEALEKPDEAIAAAGFKKRAELEELARTAVDVYTRMRDSGEYTAASVQEAFERAQAAIKVAVGDTAQLDAMDRIKGKIGELTQEYDRLFQAVADEAPEEEMGVIERQMRERMAAIEKERGGLETELEKMTRELQDAFGLVGDAAKDAAKEIVAAFTGISIPPIKVPIEFPDEIPHLGAGGIVKRPTLAMIGESGPEAVIPLSRQTPEPMIVNITTTLDGREIAHNQVRYFPDVARLYVGNAA